MTSTSTPYPKTIIVPMLVCIPVFAIVDGLSGPLMLLARPANQLAWVAIFACFGAVGAQGGLHATWLVLAPVALRVRVVIAIVVGLIWFSAWALGYAINHAWRPYQSDEWVLTATVAFLCLPLVSIGIQMPLWLARFLASWRILRLTKTSAESGPEKFGTRHLFYGMTAVVMALTATRLADSMLPRGGAMVSWAVVAVVAAIMSSFTILPMVAANLGARRMWLSLPVTFLLNILVSFAYVAVFALIERPTRIPPVLVVTIVSLVCGFFFSVTLTLLLVRSFGYRLLKGPAEGCHKPAIS